MDFFMSSAYAQASGAQPNPIVQFAPFIIIFFIFYFLMIRPQKKKMEEEQKLLANLKKGDDIYTKSGVLGKIVGLTEKVVTMDIDEGTKLKVLRSQIGGLSEKIFEVVKKDK
ncbi:MAG: preprotein translocase subunit YajC [Bdellovibrionota bacterium]|nr:preprotein translocase subunit YajC [Bdellovibrionota bacterium]